MINDSSCTINESVTDTLRSGEELTVTPAAASTVLVVRRSGDAIIESVELSAARKFGVYMSDQYFEMTLLTGTSFTATSAARTGTDPGVATKTNDNAVTGEIGELLTTVVALANVVSLTTATPKDVCSLALTPGDWDVSAVVNQALTGTTATQRGVGISLTADTMPSQAGGSGLGTDASLTQTTVFGATQTGTHSMAVGPVRVSLAATTTIHLISACTFSVGTVGAFGTLRARRVR